jgi:NAD(P)-dependent dehydrogenase (short-subunit alcohol dehydrogenase family)
VGKLDGKVAVITGGSSGMALAGAKLFVEHGAHVFISGRRQEESARALFLDMLLLNLPKPEHVRACACHRRPM